MENIISIAIIDDEPGSRDTMLAILSHSDLQYTVCGQADGVQSGLALIQAKKPDLVLLDINLSDGSGFDLLQRLDQINFAVIFITAYQEYAIRAFKVNAVDYILKPFHSEELIHALRKAAEKIRAGHTETQIRALLTGMKQTRKMIIRTAESLHVVGMHEIIRLEADGNYTRFFLQNGNNLLVSKTLKDFEEQLLPNGFFRVHQSHMINLDWIIRYDKADGGFLIMTDGKAVPVSSKRKDALLELLNAL